MKEEEGREQNSVSGSSNDINKSVQSLLEKILMKAGIYTLKISPPVFVYF